MMSADTPAAHGCVTTGAVRGVETITTGLRWKQTLPPVLVTGALDQASSTACWELGATAAASP